MHVDVHTRERNLRFEEILSILDGREQVRPSLLETALTIKTKTFDEIRGRSVLGRRLQSPIDFPGSVLAISSSEKTEREVVPELQ